ncbi:MAG: hypothetical protein KDC85_01125 [Saprospiraceae bacterium]|nr:hypothetical protein [Saprospiraceae bacterium]MCB9326849.1 hypothetical protein [Lewinellaceae bacterium]
MTKLIIISMLVFMLNIPFGYWRANVRKFSFQWVLAIHLPVPVIIAMRIFSGLGFAWYTYVFMVLAFFMGQKLGAVLLKKYNESNRGVSSCLIMDLYRNA